MAKLNVNGKSIDVKVDGDTPLLWALREQVGLTGTKYGCGIAQCGACSVHINGEVQRSCSILVKDVKPGDKIVTIEGLSKNGDHPVQKAWLALDVPQCGYCQAGQIMAAAALLKKKPKPTDADIDAAMTNICRCGTYSRIRAAIHQAAGNTSRRVHQRQQGLRRRAMTATAIRKHVSRRNFLISSAAVGGGLALGFNVPGLSEALAQLGTEGNEVGAWVFIKPNDDVIIRIARSEMGQGTLTGLAQLVAEELECDWKKVKTEYPTPGQNLARNRVWGDMSTGGSRGIRGSHDYVRKGGAAARMMLLQAAADQWKVPVAELTVADSVITHAKSNRTTTYGKVAAAAAKLPVPDPKDIKLKDPKDWKIAGKGAEAPRHRRQAHGQAGLRHRPQAARHAQRLDHGGAGVRRQGQELRRGQGQGDARRAPCPEGRRHGRRRRRRHLVAGQQGAQGREHHLGGRPQRQGLERDHHGLPQGRPGGHGRGVRRQQDRRRRRRRSPVPPRSSRPSTTPPCRTTPAWSR